MKKQAKFVIKSYPAGYRWDFKAPNGKIVASGDRAFSARILCTKAICKIRAQMQFAQIENEPGRVY